MKEALKIIDIGIDRILAYGPSKRNVEKEAKPPPKNRKKRATKKSRLKSG